MHVVQEDRFDAARSAGRGDRRVAASLPRARRIACRLRAGLSGRWAARRATAACSCTASRSSRPKSGAATCLIERGPVRILGSRGLARDKLAARQLCAATVRGAGRGARARRRGDLRLRCGNGDDLDHIAAASAATATPTFFVGTAGLAHALARTRLADRPRFAPLDIDRRVAAPLLVVGFAGAARHARRWRRSRRWHDSARASRIVSAPTAARRCASRGANGARQAARALEAGTDVLVDIAARRSAATWRSAARWSMRSRAARARVAAHASGADRHRRRNRRGAAGAVLRARHPARR